jgi:hypothetical protein
MTQTEKLTDALSSLTQKWGVATPESWRLVANVDELQAGGDTTLSMIPGDRISPTDALPASAVPLLPWRAERRFVELKRLVDQELVTPVLMCRFANLTDRSGPTLAEMLYREFDLVEWITGRTVEDLYFTMGASPKGEPEFSANGVISLDDRSIASIEVGRTSPRPKRNTDRHELIGRRAVACDRVVDTQVAQASVYTTTESGDDEYTDVDFELFGLSVEEVATVRSAFELFSNPKLADELTKRHGRLVDLVQRAFQSAKGRTVIKMKGGAA